MNQLPHFITQSIDRCDELGNGEESFFLFLQSIFVSEKTVFDLPVFLFTESFKLGTYGETSLEWLQFAWWFAKIILFTDGTAVTISS